jgi:hypothetical protein
MFTKHFLFEIFRKNQAFKYYMLLDRTTYSNVPVRVLLTGRIWSNDCGHGNIVSKSSFVLE